MKKSFISLGFSLLLLIGVLDVQTNPNQPPAGRTGAPSETTCAAAGCHSGSPISPVDQVSLTAKLASDTALNALTGFVYKADSTYQFRLTLNNLSGRYGFEASCRKKSDNSSQGNIQLTDALNTKLLNLGLQRYIGHKNADTTHVFTFDWTAPSAGADTLMWYFAAMSSNNNNNSSGDIVYKLAIELAPEFDSTLSGVQADIRKNFSVRLLNGPFPGVVQLQVTTSSSDLIRMHLFDLKGRLSQSSDVRPERDGPTIIDFQTRGLASGLYFLHLEQLGRSRVLKLQL